jgi:hypothetical protein
MARLYLKKTLTGFEPADAEAFEIHRRYKVGEIYRGDLVKPRNYKHHKLCMALLTLTYQNQERFTNFDLFRKAVAFEAGHRETFMTIDGELKEGPGSLSYDALDEIDFTRVFGAMMTVCCAILGMTAPELEGEVSRYADEHYGQVAA